MFKKEENVPDVMGDAETFLQRHQPKLLRYLDGKAPQSPGEPDVSAYVEQVLDEWSDSFTGRQLSSPCRTERTFWFVLYLLEELVENPVQRKLDPYERILLQHLAQARELLRGWRELPEEFYATRPGEDFGDGF